MKIKSLKFKDTNILYPKLYKDRRGFFYEQYNSKIISELGIKFNLKQSNVSYSKKNILRGIHFQKKSPQNQFMQVILGCIDLVLVDFRKDSKTFLNKIYFKLDSKKKEIIHTPPGVGSAFLTRSNKNVILYHVDKYFNSKNEVGIIWNDNTLNINWAIKKPILSYKDKKNITVKEYFKI